jgi:hypothetical protein
MDDPSIITHPLHSAYVKRVRHYEHAGMTTSDAQGAADADHMSGRLTGKPQKRLSQVRKRK